MAKKKNKYSDNWIIYDGVKITDMDVAKFVREHTHWYDRLNWHKMSDAGIEAQLFLMHVIEMPKKKKWYLGDREGS